MYKIFTSKLIVALITTTTVGTIGGISMKDSPMFHKEDTMVRSSKVSNIKENYTKNVTVDSENANKDNADENLTFSSDEKTENDDLQNNVTNTNKQEIMNSKTEKANNTNSSHNSNQQADTSSQVIESNNSVNTENQNIPNIIPEVKIPTIHYDRTTSIYANDNVTLLRVEYYVNNKLTYYSEVVQFDATTKSYIEKIYQCNRETNIDPLIRTDVYVNGNLTKSY